MRGLSPAQSFSVILMHEHGQQPAELAPTLMSASAENKHRLNHFLVGGMVDGETDPIPAIEAAFAQKPDLIYLVSDGDFPDNDAVLARMRDLNKGHKIRVNTIAFVGEPDKDTSFITLLKTITQESGGTYTHVNEKDIPRRGDPSIGGQ